MRRFFTAALIFCALPLAAANAPAAQDMLRAAAVVNDEVVSGLDLDMRLRLAILATGQPDSEQLRDRMTQQVIRTLIDERLQTQEATRLGITISDEQVQDAAQSIAQRNNMSYENFTRFLQNRGIIPNAFLDQVRAAIRAREREPGSGPPGRHDHPGSGPSGGARRGSVPRTDTRSTRLG